jgi:serine/threonine protein kinase
MNIQKQSIQSSQSRPTISISEIQSTQPTQSTQQSTNQSGPPMPTMTEEIKPSSVNPKEIHFLNQGTFGCVFRPEITCDGEIGDVAYISKIQPRSKTVDNEINIGNKLKINNPNHEYYYAPIIQNCSVNIQNIRKEEILKCNVFNNTDTATNTNTNTNTNLTTSVANTVPKTLSKYISTKIRYIGSKNLEVYFLNLPADPNVVIKKLYTTYHHLSRGIEKLLENQIIHYDVKDTNIMYDEACQLPIFIDFGLTIDLKKVTPDTYKNAFYTSEYYGYWSIDIYILSQIIQRIKNVTPPSIQENQTVTEETIQRIVTQFVTEFTRFIEKYSYPFTQEEIETFTRNHIDRLKPFIGKDWDEVFKALFVPKVYEKWDKYGLSMTYYIFLKSLNLIQWKGTRLFDYMTDKWKADILEVIPI